MRRHVVVSGVHLGPLVNISFACFAKTADLTPVARRLSNDALSRVCATYGLSPDEPKKMFLGRVFCFNTDRMKGWAPSTWHERGRTVLSFSAPPIPLHEVTQEEYPDELFKLAAAGEGLCRFNPGYFGVRSDGRSLTAWSDLFGVGRSYYVENEHFFAISNSISSLLLFTAHENEIDHEAWAAFAGFGWFTGDGSPFKGVSRVPPATVFHLSAEGSSSWRYAEMGSFVSPEQRAPRFDAAASQMRAVACNAGRMLASPATVYLSGGRDSRLTTAVWLASGSPASVMTWDTLSQEASVACDLMSRAAETIDFDAQQITHTVGKKVRRVEDAEPSGGPGASERARRCMQIWDGDHPPIRLNYPVGTMRSNRVKIGGGGEEIAHGNYYATERLLNATKGRRNPLQRLREHFCNIGGVRPRGKDLIRRRFAAVAERAASLEISGPTQLDYFYLSERFRRWVAAGHSTEDILLFGAPAFVRLAFDVTPEERLSGLVHRELTSRLIPQWREVQYYKARPVDADERTLKKTRIWQGYDRDAVFDAVLSGKHYPLHWNREHILEVSLKTLTGLAQGRHEAILHKILWFEEFSKYASTLIAETEKTKRRAMSRLQQAA